MRHRVKRINNGFTLIELLVVIAIIGVLASIVLASLSSARAKGRDAARRSNVKSLETALELYANDNNGNYPSLGTDGTGYPLTNLATPLVPQYISSIPSDPSGYTWGYVRGPATAYGIRVELDDKSYCVTGVNVQSGWWGGPPSCGF